MIKIGNININPDSCSFHITNILNGYKQSVQVDGILTFSYSTNYNQVNILDELNSDVIYDDKVFKIKSFQKNHRFVGRDEYKIEAIWLPYKKPVPEQHHPNTNAFI